MDKNQIIINEQNKRIAALEARVKLLEQALARTRTEWETKQTPTDAVARQYIRNP